MLEYLQKKENFNTVVELGVAVSLFILLLVGVATFSEIVVHILSFVVLLEVIKVISGFITSKEHVVQLRTVIDGFIVFFLRDLVLIFSNEKYSFIEKENKLIMLGIILFSLFIFRILALKFSPNDKNCESCVVLSENLRKKIKDHSSKEQDKPDA
jgi:uncharacterized membrane protein (DUF373 family)